VATFSAVSGMESTPYISFISLLTKRQPMVVSYTALLRAEGALGLGHHERRAAHALDAAGDHQPGFAGLDGARGAAHGIETGAAQAVDGGARHVQRQAGQQRAMRATLRLSSPAWLAQPYSTSVTACQSTLGLRSISARSGMAPRSSVRTEDSAPP
jgi:hypothetical protein